MTVYTVDRSGGKVLVRHTGGRTHEPVVEGKSLEIDGCDTVVPGRGSIKVWGCERIWKDGDVVHMSDRKRNDDGLGGVDWL